MTRSKVVAARDAPLSLQMIPVDPAGGNQYCNTCFWSANT
jgi:hypothetical protein